MTNTISFDKRNTKQPLNHMGRSLDLKLFKFSSMDAELIPDTSTNK